MATTALPDGPSAGFADGIIAGRESDHPLARDVIAGVIAQLVDTGTFDGQRVVVLVPDGTRSAPMPLLAELLGRALAGRVARLQWLVALGTHQPMDAAALHQLLGHPPGEIVNHDWGNPSALVSVGAISAEEMSELSGGRSQDPVDVRVNRLVVDADVALVCGPVFPHEVVGFSGGNKYFFPGVSGPEVIDATHWLGALITSREIIGTEGITPVRAVINRAAALIPTERLALSVVVQPGGHELRGVWAGTPEASWAAAASLSARVHIRTVAHPYRTVLSLMPARYDDIWTAAKGMYKLEPVVANGGEVIIYAPHITEISVTHGALLAEVGYHVRDYFLGQWDRYGRYPGSILAHSTHVRGAGTWDATTGEHPRITVSLATAIDRATTEAHNLSYRDPAAIDVAAWTARAATDDSLLVVPDAGETLYRLAGG
jgi:nickel-dependent lactate racemase